MFVKFVLKVFLLSLVKLVSCVKFFSWLVFELVDWFAS